jgi:hypothetical protein
MHTRFVQCEKFITYVLHLIDGVLVNVCSYCGCSLYDIDGMEYLISERTCCYRYLMVRAATSVHY